MQESLCRFWRFVFKIRHCLENWPQLHSLVTGVCRPFGLLFRLWQNLKLRRKDTKHIWTNTTRLRTASFHKAAINIKKQCLFFTSLPLKKAHNVAGIRADRGSGWTRPPLYRLPACHPSISGQLTSQDVSRPPWEMSPPHGCQPPATVHGDDDTEVPGSFGPISGCVFLVSTRQTKQNHLWHFC